MRTPSEGFPEAAARELGNAQLRANLGNATGTIRDKRARVVAELPDWQALRDAGSAIKADVMAGLDSYLLQFEEALQAAGATVHWARDSTPCWLSTASMPLRPTSPS
jgi:L-lactate dehydrogenase complex protein LldF